MSDDFPISGRIVDLDLARTLQPAVPTSTELAVSNPGTAIERYPDSFIGAFDNDRVERAKYVFRVARILWDIARLYYPAIPEFEEDMDRAVEMVTLLDHYDRHRQWSPFPVGTPAAVDRKLQSRLVDIASELLGMAPVVPFGGSLVPRRGWKSGVTKPHNTQYEIDTAARMGYAATQAYRGPSKINFSQESEAFQKSTRELADKVLTLAKIHQIDAVRVGVLEHNIDPRFSAPIVADVAYGGATRKT
jgi:hypothetical protein